MRDSLLLEEKYDISIASKEESIQEFENFGSDQQIDFQDYQLEDKQVKLLQRFKDFLFQPLDLDPSDQNFATAFCGGMR